MQFLTTFFLLWFFLPRKHLFYCRCFPSQSARYDFIPYTHLLWVGRKFYWHLIKSCLISLPSTCNLLRFDRIVRLDFLLKNFKMNKWLSFAVEIHAFAPWPLTTDFENLIRNAHSQDEYLCQVSLKYEEIIANGQITDGRMTGQQTGKHVAFAADYSIAEAEKRRWCIEKRKLRRWRCEWFT